MLCAVKMSGMAVLMNSPRLCPVIICRVAVQSKITYVRSVSSRDVVRARGDRRCGFNGSDKNSGRLPWTSGVRSPVRSVNHRPPIKATKAPRASILTPSWSSAARTRVISCYPRPPRHLRNFEHLASIVRHSLPVVLVSKLRVCSSTTAFKARILDQAIDHDY